MASTRQFVRSWSGGEIAPELFGRLDDARYQQGAEKLRNFICRLGGALQRRPGFEFVRAVKDSTKATRLFPFVYSTGQAYAVEMGEGYFRFHADGGTLLHAKAMRVASVDVAGNTVTFEAPHGWASNDAVVFIADGGSVPSGLVSGTTYYAIPVDTHTVQVSAFSGPLGAVDILGAGTGTIYGYRLLDAPPRYLAANVASVVGGTVTSVDPGTDTITTSPNHGFVTGQPIRFATTTFSGSPIVGLSSSVTWFAIVTGANTLKAAATLSDALGGVAVNLTSATLAGVPIVYRTQALRATAHGFATGDQVRFTVTSGLMYGGISADISYTVTVESVDVFRIDDVALQVDPFTGLGLGSTSVSYDYQAGDIVTYASGFYTCIVDHPTLILPGTASHWLEQSLDGVFEIPNDYDEADLFGVHYTQSGDVKTLVHQSHPPAELRRRGPTLWDFTPIEFNNALDVPTNVSVSAVTGATSTITSVVAVGASSPMEFVCNGSTGNHFLSVGESVYLAQPSGLNIGAAASNRFYAVLTTPNNFTFTLREVVGGAPVVGGSSGAAPASATVQVASDATEITSYYRVTSVDSEGRESEGSAVANVLNNLLAPGSYNTITWSAVPNAFRYNVYKAVNGISGFGVYGFIGSSRATTFVDDNIAPDLGTQIPLFDTSLSGVDYPGAVAYFEGRRVFAGTFSQPQTVWMTNTAQPDSLAYHIPVKDSDRLLFQPDSIEASKIEHLVPIQHLVAITSATEYRIGGINSDVITPDSISVRPQSYIGGSSVQPVVVNKTIVFVAFLGGHLFEMGYTANDGYQPADLCLRAPHLFDDTTVTDLAYAKSPVPMLWAISSNGRLLGCTYAPEEQVGGWHVHTTAADGRFESVCAIPEGDEYRLYAIVRRTINGSSVRYVERLASLKTPAALAESRHVDAGGQFYGIDTTGTTISVTPASSWASGSTVTIGVSAGGPIFRTGSPSPDIGDRVTFTYLGRLFDATITAVASGSSATATLTQAVTAANGTTLAIGTVPSIGGIAVWGFKRDSLSGLDHLEGEVVQVLADGVLTTKTVSSGAITGLTPSLRITYGLPIVSELLTLPLLYGSDSYGQGRTAAVSEVWLRTRRTETFQIAQGEAGDQVPFAASFDNANTVDRCMPRGRWDETGQLYVQQDEPYPLTLVSMTIKASIGS